MKEKKLFLTYGASNELRRMGFENEGYIDYEIYKKYSEELVDTISLNLCLCNNILTLPHESNCRNCPFEHKNCNLTDCYEVYFEKFFESEVY